VIGTWSKELFHSRYFAEKLFQTSILLGTFSFSTILPISSITVILALDLCASMPIQYIDFTSNGVNQSGNRARHSTIRHINGMVLSP
ncbi:MAG: hypothetical protein ACP5TX_06470, partial [Thermoplasmata archaeon]